MFYILSGGTEPFRAASRSQALEIVGFTVGTPDVELNLLAGESGIDLTTISAEGKHLLPLMLRSRPGDRATLDEVLAHPLFWTTEKQLQYLSEIGGLLPDCVHRSQHALTDEIEKLLDSNLGPYNALKPEV